MLSKHPMKMLETSIRELPSSGQIVYDTFCCLNIVPLWNVSFFQYIENYWLYSFPPWKILYTRAGLALFS